MPANMAGSIFAYPFQPFLPLLFLNYFIERGIFLPELSTYTRVNEAPKYSMMDV